MIYIVLYGLLLFLAMIDMIRPLKNKNADFVILILAIIFSLFRGLRWDTGTDWDGYLDLYNNSSFSNIFSYDKYGTEVEMQEPGIVFINAIFNTFFPYTLYLLLSNAFILWAYKYTVCHFLPKRRLFAFCFLIMSVAFFPVRQEIANALIMLSLPFLIKRNYLIFILVSFIAVSIHKSSAFMLFVIWAVHKIRFSPSMLLVVFISSTLIGVVVIQTLAKQFAPFILALNAGYEHNYESYTETITDNAGVSLLAVLLPFSLIAICGFCMKKCFGLRHNENYFLFLKLMTLFFCLNTLLGNTGLTLLMRLTKYLFFADAFVLAYVANSLCEINLSFLRPKLSLYLLMLLIGSMGVNRFFNKCHHYPELMFPYISVFDDEKRNDAAIEFNLSVLMR